MKRNSGNHRYSGQLAEEGAGGLGGLGKELRIGRGSVGGSTLQDKAKAPGENH